jgi:hypothetical protein
MLFKSESHQDTPAGLRAATEELNASVDAFRDANPGLAMAGFGELHVHASADGRVTLFLPVLFAAAAEEAEPWE